FVIFGEMVGLARTAGVTAAFALRAADRRIGEAEIGAFVVIGGMLIALVQGIGAVVGAAAAIVVRVAADFSIRIVVAAGVVQDIIPDPRIGRFAKAEALRAALRQRETVLARRADR